MSRVALQCLVAFIAATVVMGHGNPSSVLDKESFTNNMVKHFEVLQHARHPKNATRDAWLNTRTYIQQQLESIGLQVENQCFNTTVMMQYEDYQKVMGCNIIGTTKGTSTKNLLVVGAHYDSSSEHGSYQPLLDNGVGVAVLIEVAKAFEESVRWKGFEKNYTTIFVAFDLNTKEQSPKSPGHPGSYLFVNDWLMPWLSKKRMVLGGSFILDSIATYNTEENSQVLPADFKTVFPTAFERISTNAKKGDFLAAIGSGQSEELIKDFAGHYRMDRQSHPYRLQEMVPEGLEFGTGKTIEMVNHQASFHFWMNKPSMPSVLLTDTDANRVLPQGKQCADTSGDCSYVFPTPESMQFVYHTYNALANTLLARQTTYGGLISGGSSSWTSTSLLSLVLAVMLARLLARS